jgi:hypothetical protein
VRKLLSHARKCLFLALLLCCCACVSEPSAQEQERTDAGTKGVEFAMERQARIRIAGLHRLQGAALLHSLQVLISCGTNARAAAIEALAAPQPEVRAGLAYVLGFIGGEDSIVALKSRLTDADAGVRYESAAALLQLGNAAGMPTLIDLLGHADARMRLKAMECVQERAGTDFGFRFDGTETERRAACERVRLWWHSAVGPVTAGRTP